MVEAFQKGPIAFSASVSRKQKNSKEAVLPLFQVPVLDYKDELKLSFSGEAFDKRVTSADWSAIVVFLPKTVAPTSQGVVSFRLNPGARGGGPGMTIPDISVPYDSVPMICLIPDRNGRKKVLKDLNAHLEQIRTLCDRIADLSEQRAAADKFLDDLAAIDKDLSPIQYDNALVGFLHSYGDPTSTELQTFLNGSSTNLAKAQTLASDFRKTNILVPSGGNVPDASPTPTTTSTASGMSSYVSILFDVANIISNLWPGHQFHYMPALARNFHGTSADLYYNDWIQTTGETRGALLCCPGKWSDQTPPSLNLDLPAGESLLNPTTRIHVVATEKNRSPFRLFGHEWKLKVIGPKGEILASQPLTTIPQNQSFLLKTAPLLSDIRKIGALRVKIQVTGEWGFQHLSSETLEVPVGFDPAWKPTAAEVSAFRLGGACGFRFPETWAGVVQSVSFQPSHARTTILAASMMPRKDGAREAVFQPREEDRGRGTLELRVYGSTKPVLSIPLTLKEAAPVFTGIEARLGETTVALKGSSLDRVQEVLVDHRKFVPCPIDDAEPSSLTCRAEDKKPLSGAVGRELSVEVILDDGKKLAHAPVPLGLARPVLGTITLSPVQTKVSGLAITCSSPVAPAGSLSLVGLLAAGDYRFPYDRSFHIAVHNQKEPSDVHLIDSKDVKVVGNSLKAAFILDPSQLQGGASGKLEIQVQDKHAGNSDWVPLPATFLDLPVIAAIEPEGSGWRISGSSLDPIDSAAPTPVGPWQKLAVSVQDGREVADLTTPLPGGVCYLKLVGWGDLVLSVKVPPPPTQNWWHALESL
jgi:hypothetical protein